MTDLPAVYEVALIAAIAVVLCTIVGAGVILYRRAKRHET